MMETKQVTVEEMNRAIAIFMNYQMESSAAKFCFDNNKMLYHLSWDWLMPVFLKILKWGSDYNGVQWEQAIDQDGVRMSDFRNGKLRVGSFNPRGTVDIESVHKVVYDFIIWYNKQNH